MIRSTIDSPTKRSWLSWLSGWMLPKRFVAVPVELGEVLDRFPEGFFIIDGRFHILFANEAICQILGISHGHLEGRSVDSLKWCSSMPRNRPWHDALRTARSERTNPQGVPIAVGDEQLMLYERSDQSRRLLAITVREITGLSIPDVMVISVRDATVVETYRAEMEDLLARVRRSREEAHQSNEHLRQLVTQDALTGCNNRRSLDEQADVLWKDSTEDGKPLSCMMFDIDHFKSVNDEYGHATGDEVLRCVGTSLLHTFENVGQVYRYGGEEFCVMLPDHDLNAARSIGEKVRSTVSHLSVHSATTNEVIQVTVSIGVVDRNAGANSVSEMIDQADKCLYMAKRNGRNCVVGYGPEVASAKFRSSDR
ncbi:diguanylate cyclase (GGDEF)-like protein/PAS domain S-box-containing protein [Rhodopirellula rubra]|uniref:diguanylate cyclase n=1 Tax=Aporhodopirellula rubra TaxID=980271 RepID=A0A7W5H9C7_9BACT|nr:sensor domain-containing diguanylate cyclase [Aporhodopirellula rubra]MBB3210264.1 diguanylate cyclase (GGDEF)-like protein/PAS domain S-box-containing protein [Aporhodopirellula rubra]